MQFGDVVNRDEDFVEAEEALKLPDAHPFYTSKTVQDEVAKHNKLCREWSIALWNGKPASTFVQYKICPRTGELLPYDQHLPCFYVSSTSFPIAPPNDSL